MGNDGPMGNDGMNWHPVRRMPRGGAPVASVAQRQSPVAMLLTLLLAALLCFAISSFPRNAAAQQKSQKQIAAEISENYGVDVLRISDVELPDGTTVYEVMVMNRGGNYNEAFQVTRLLVDPATGALIPGFRHGTSGYDLSGAPSYSSGRDGADMMLRHDSLR
jgi:hypothetical protein